VVEKPLRGPIRLWDATPSSEPEAETYVRTLYSRLGFFDEVTASFARTEI